MPSIEAKMEVDKELGEKIKETDAFVRSAIDLIPIDNWGFDETVRERIRQHKHKLVNAKLTTKQKRKLSKASKQKLSRAEPGVCRTVTQVWDWMATTNLSKITPKKPKKPKISLPKKESSDKSGDEGDESASEEKNTEVKKKKKKQVKRRKNDKVSNGKSSAPAINIGTETTAAIGHLATRQEALIKLQEKLDQLKSKRMGGLSARDFDERKKLKRRMSKVKLKDKRKSEKKPKILNANAETSSKGTTEPNAGSHGLKPACTTEDGKMVFSKFDFIVNEPEPPKNSKEAKKERRKANKGDFKGKDYNRLLVKVGKEQEKIKRVREKDAEKGERLEENIKWNKAIHRAQGDKVKDNPELLKKGLKRKQQQKKKSEKKWEAREKSRQMDKEKKEDKRNRNMKKRRDDKKRRKLHKASKKGRIA